MIIGTGAAGLYCALNLPSRKKVLMLTKQSADLSDSFLAQGGICMLRGVRFMAETCKILSPDKKVWLANPAAGCPMAVPLTCMNMKITTLMDVHNCLKGRSGEEIKLPQNVMDGAGRCIRRMVELGG